MALRFVEHAGAGPKLLEVGEILQARDGIVLATHEHNAIAAAESLAVQRRRQMEMAGRQGGFDAVALEFIAECAADR